MNPDDVLTSPENGFANAPDGSYQNRIEITPSDTENIQIDGQDAAVRALYLPAPGGTVKYDMVGKGTACVDTFLPGWIPLQVKKIYATGTTATNIRGVF